MKIKNENKKWSALIFRVANPIRAELHRILSTSENQPTYPQNPSFIFGNYLHLFVFMVWRCLPMGWTETRMVLAIGYRLWPQLKLVFQDKLVFFGEEFYDMDTFHRGLKPANVSVVTRPSGGIRIGGTKPLTGGAPTAREGRALSQ